MTDQSPIKWIEKSGPVRAVSDDLRYRVFDVAYANPTAPFRAMWTPVIGPGRTLGEFVDLAGAKACCEALVRAQGGVRARLASAG